MPTIILKGKWLKDAGFQVGEYLEIICDGNKITLTKTTPPEATLNKSLEDKSNSLRKSKQKKLSEMIDVLQEAIKRSFFSTSKYGRMYVIMKIANCHIRCS